MPRLTQAFVEKIDLSDSQKTTYIFDEGLTGFGVRVSGDKKIYIAQGRVGGTKVRLKIASHEVLSLEQARIEAKKLLAQMAQGIDPRTQRIAQKAKAVTLGELIEPYIRARKLRPTTIKLYEGALRRCFSDWQHKPITEITKDMVQARHEKISNAHGPRGKGEAHANQAMRVLRSLLNYANSVYEDADGRPVMDENPVTRLSQAKLWNRNKRRTDFIQREDLKPWFQAVLKLENPIARDFFIVCLFTGLRRNEAAQLKWSDIDFKSNILRVPGDRTKNYEEHLLPLSDYLEALFLHRKDANDALQDAKSEFVFPGTGGKGHLIEVKRAVANVIDESEVKFMTHGLRRTFLTVGESLDISHYTLKRLANHKFGGDVTGGYIQLTVDRLREPMQRITDAILEHAEIKKKGSKTKQQK